MKTKWIRKIILCFLVVFGLSACTNVEQEKQDVTAVIDGYFELLHEGKVFKACEKYTNKEFQKENKILDYQEEIENQIASLNLDESFNTEAEDYITYVFSKMYQSHKIETIEIEEDHAIVKTSMEGIFPEELNLMDESINEKMEKLWNDYFSQNEARLTQMIIADEEAASQYIISELTPSMFSCYKESIDALEEHTKEVEFQLVKKEDVWKIVEMK